MNRILPVMIVILLFLPMSELISENNTLNLLTNSVWKMYSRNELGWIKMCTFDNCMMKTTVQYKGECTEKNYRFYLSDKVEIKFDESRMGVQKNGNYLVFEIYPDISDCRPGVYEIVQLNKTVLKLRIVKDLQIVTYVRVKKNDHDIKY